MPTRTSDPAEGTEVEVVGVVPDVRTSVSEPPVPLFYRSTVQEGAPTPTVIVRTTGAPSGLLLPMQRALREVDRGLPVIASMTMTQRVDDSLAAARVAGRFLGGLGLLGLALASVGLYAVVAFAVSRRSLEIGIRMALGAQRRQVVWTLSRDVAQLLAFGVTLGLSGSPPNAAMLRCTHPSAAMASDMPWLRDALRPDSRVNCGCDSQPKGPSR